LFIRRLQKFLSLEPADQRILLYAFCLVVFSRLVLWVIPFPKINRRLATRVRPRTISRRQSIEYFMTAIDRSSHYVPGATCLTQALAARLLLARAGFDASLRFGARRNEAGVFEAHAWVESDGKVVSHKQPGLTFSPLPPVG
jgi:hypothetical protein